MLGMTADETERQRETLPLAVKRVTHRIILYYVLAVFALGLNISANDPVFQSGNITSGFTLMVLRAGIPRLNHVINAVLVIAALSVAAADLYCAVCISSTIGN